MYIPVIKSKKAMVSLCLTQTVAVIFNLMSKNKYNKNQYILMNKYYVVSFGQNIYIKYLI